jgi:hypothetical protein
MIKPNFAAQDGNLTVQQLSAFLDNDGSLILVRTSEHGKPTFKYAGTFTPVAAPTDALMIQGSATKTLRIKKIVLGGVATSNGNMLASLIRRSAQFTTQGSAVFTPVSPGKMDTTDATATGVVSTIGTANLTSVGASAGVLAQQRLFMPTTATGVPAPLVWEFATRQDKALILRGVADFIFLNLNGGAVPAGGVIDFEIEIEEDAS